LIKQANKVCEKTKFLNSNNQLLFFFSALGAFNGIVLSVYFALMAKKKTFSNYFLALLMLVLSIRIIKSVFFYFNPDLSNVFIQIGLSACLLIGPFLFLYLKSTTGYEKINWPIHVIPYLIGITILGSLYPYVEHRNIWSNWIVQGIYLQWLVYIIVSLKYLKPIYQKFKAKEQLKNIEVWLLSIYFGIFFIWLAYNVASYTSYIVGALSFTFILYLILLLIVFRYFKQSNIFEEKEKYKNKAIEAETKILIKQKLSRILEKELFLNSNFTLEEAAKELKVSRHMLSQYVNEILGQSFSDLIKAYRIEKAKKLLATENNRTIESMGYDIGFNSKSSFFTAFKKITGLTPAEYQKSISK
jgi:AraC-like DNA-binding protein